MGTVGHRMVESRSVQSPRRSMRDALRHPNVGRWERVGSVLAGTALLAYALRRRRSAAGGGGTGALVAAVPLLQRGLSGRCAMYAGLGVNRAQNASDTRVALGGTAGMHIHESIVIAKPVREVYEFWRRLENLPLFMSNIDSVTQVSATRSRWVARGPAGSRLEWDAEIINDIPDQLIGWRSVEGADVVTAGSVKFERAFGEPGTLVTVRMQYAPPAGRLGATISSLLGQNPVQMDQGRPAAIEDAPRSAVLSQGGSAAVSYR